MRWIWIAVAAAACGLSGMAGFTVGVNMNPEATTRYVLNWGSLGDWVSGTGALLAVLVTLWLADRSRREDVEHLVITPKMALPFGPGGTSQPFVAVDLVSKGKRPVTVVSMNVASKHSKHGLWVTQFARHSPVTVLPKRLDYGELANIHLQVGFHHDVQTFVDDTCEGKTDGLRLVINTTTGHWEAPFSDAFINVKMMDEGK